MISFFRKLSWWIQRHNKETELRDELQFHLAEEEGEREAAGLAGRKRRGTQRAANWAISRWWRRTRAPCGAGRSLTSLARTCAMRFARWLPAGIYAAWRLVAGARNRSQHGDIQLHGRDSDAFPAGVRSTVTGGTELARQVHRTGFRDAQHERQHMSDPRSGKRAESFLTLLSNSSGRTIGVLDRVCALRILQARRLNVAIRGQAEHCEWLERVGRLFSRARRSACRWDG